MRVLGLGEIVSFWNREIKKQKQTLFDYNSIHLSLVLHFATKILRSLELKKY